MMRFRYRPTSVCCFMAMALLLFASACDDLMEKQFFNADYQIKGKISSVDNPAQGVVGIRVICQHADLSDTAYTNAQGEYALLFNDSAYASPRFKLKVEDADGGLNGGDFASQTIELSVGAEDWVDSGDDEYYYGKALKVVDVLLTSK